MYILSEHNNLLYCHANLKKNDDHANLSEMNIGKIGHTRLTQSDAVMTPSRVRHVSGLTASRAMLILRMIKQTRAIVLPIGDELNLLRKTDDFTVPRFFAYRDRFELKY